MKNGFIKAAAATVNITVADVKSNIESIKEQISASHAMGVNLLILPELCVTGYSCADLFFSQKLIGESVKALEELAGFTADKYPVVAVGLPMPYGNKLYNCAAVLHNGKVLGIVPKTALPNYAEFSEMRYFASADTLCDDAVIRIGGEDVPFGAGLIFKNRLMSDYTFGIEICEDAWGAETVSEALCRSGAVIIGNLSASDEIIGKANYRRRLIEMTSARLLCGYVYSNADHTESTQDVVFSRHLMICENGTRLAENPPFGNSALIASEIDVEKLCLERRKNTSFVIKNCCRTVEFSQELKETMLTRSIEKNPFVPENSESLNERAADILTIQCYGLKKRLEHTHAKTAVIGISGGLDSTLALLVTVRAMKLCGRPLSDIIAVTMPCFGTTARTKSNAVSLCEELGVAVREVNITNSVLSHFEDIGQSPDCLDVTYENAQARERTQVLMDIANKTGGLVIGTGDLSELALGWATYNGDHMSMYSVNCSVPKTLVRYIVKYEAENCNGKLKEILEDILDTPVSPELLPAKDNGDIAQKTEDLVGPYELHDFFLYYTVRFGFTPSKIFRLCRIAYEGIYSDETVLHWLTVFTRRFFSQQFKRSCVPDGPKVGSVSLSPRGDLRMPSDASSALWLEEIGQLKKSIE